MPSDAPAADGPSLENLVESGLIELESLHPGGLELTDELASLCAVSRGTRVLDVASGTGETACHLSAALGAKVCGLDHSEALLARARAKAAQQGLDVAFCTGSAEAMPFPAGTFDVAICECTLCLLDKPAALNEMARVVRSGGRVAMHDLFWNEGASESVKRRLAEYEGEYPETLDGWRGLFADAGLEDLRVVDRTTLKHRWMQDMRSGLGLGGYVRLAAYALRRWGVSGLWRLLQSERVFESPQLGYAIVVGTRP